MWTKLTIRCATGSVKSPSVQRNNAKFYFQFCDLLRNRNLLFATARGDSSSLWITQFDFQLSSNFRFTLISSFE